MASIARDGLDFDKIYPIGSIYISANSTNPHDLFGGTWEQLRDRFLLGCGTKENGTIGGEENHTLTVAESPSHNHRELYWGDGTPNQFGVNRSAGGGLWGFDYWSTGPNCSDANFYTNYVGGNQAHNNMPPYLAVYMWKRIS